PPVDDHPVSLVRRNPSGAGVRLCDVPLVLKSDHVVTYGGAGNTETVSIHDCLGSHGFLVGDVVGDDGPQHLEPPFLGTGHRTPPAQSGRTPRPPTESTHHVFLPGCCRRNCVGPARDSYACADGKHAGYRAASSAAFSWAFSSAFSARQPSSSLPRRQ